MDTIFYNGNIITMDALSPSASAVAVKNGIIVRVGSDAEVLALASGRTQKIDLKGGLMLPGFIDSHMHLLSYGYSLEKVNLGACRSIDAIVGHGRSFLAERPHLRWLQGRGWNNDMWDGARFPTRYDLDKISADVPVTLTRCCGHIIIANSKALEVMGVSRETAQTPGGHFDLDENGEPLGIFREEARAHVYNAIPALTAQDIKRMLVNGGTDAQKYGITSVQSDDFEAVTEREDEHLLAAYTELARGRELPVRVYQQCLLPPVGRLKSFIARGYKTGVGDEYFKIGPLKLLCDGTLGARTALMSKPYADDPSTRGIAVYEQSELDELVATAHNAGMTVALHSIGDGCTDMCLDAIERAALANPRTDMRHSLIHCQITRGEQLERFRALGVIAHIQPIFIDYDMHIVETRVGKQLAQTCYNWRRMADSGVRYACGSDCPVEHFNVLEGIYCAVTSKDRSQKPDGGWMPDQRLTVQQAVHGFTLSAAYASYEENIKGSISVNKLADFAVIDRDIFSIAPEEIKDARVDMTVLGGKIVYCRG